MAETESPDCRAGGGGAVTAQVNALQALQLLERQKTELLKKLPAFKQSRTAVQTAALQLGEILQSSDGIGMHNLTRAVSAIASGLLVLLNAQLAQFNLSIEEMESQQGQIEIQVKEFEKLVGLSKSGLVLPRKG
jgi:hypothetical protein